MTDDTQTSQAMEDNGLKGNLKQPDNFTTCGKLNLEIKQYNNPKEVFFLLLCICVCIQTRSNSFWDFNFGFAFPVLL